MRFRFEGRVYFDADDGEHALRQIRDHFDSLYAEWLAMERGEVREGESGGFWYDGYMEIGPVLGDIEEVH